MTESLKQSYIEDAIRLAHQSDRRAALAELVGMISGIVNFPYELPDDERIRRIRFLLSNYNLAQVMSKEDACALLIEKGGSYGDEKTGR